MPQGAQVLAGVAAGGAVRHVDVLTGESSGSAVIELPLRPQDVPRRICGIGSVPTHSVIAIAALLIVGSAAAAGGGLLWWRLLEAGG